MHLCHQQHLSQPVSMSSASAALPSSCANMLLNMCHVMQSLGKGHKHANPDKARDPVLGDILVVIAQMAAALQFIIEEKYLAKYRVPALLGVGLEGMWGLLLSAIALPILSIVKGSDGLAMDSLFSAFREISHSWQLQVGHSCQLQSAGRCVSSSTVLLVCSLT